MAPAVGLEPTTKRSYLFGVLVSVETSAKDARLVAQLEARREHSRSPLGGEETADCSVESRLNVWVPNFAAATLAAAIALLLQIPMGVDSLLNVLLTVVLVAIASESWADRVA